MKSNSIKPEQSPRLAFKFFKSYFEIACRLEDVDRLAFYDALVSKQFLNIEPKLSGLADFAYTSQKFSIDKQVKGWEDKMKTELKPKSAPPMQGDNVGGSAHPELQE